MANVLRTVTVIKSQINTKLDFIVKNKEESSMGLFSKEAFVCSKCGKEFSARFNTSGMCKECTEEAQKEDNENF